MARLPKSGGAFWFPPGDPSLLDRVAQEMSKSYDVRIKHTDADRQTIWLALAAVNGQRRNEVVRPTREDVAACLRWIRRELLKAKKGDLNAHVISRFLSALHEGPTDATPAQFEALYQLKVELAARLGVELDHGYAHPVQCLLVEPLQHIDQLRDAAKAALNNVQKFKGPPGRERLDYYDRFTWILISLCERYDLSPRLARKKATNRPQGALVDLARLMEQFLDKSFQTSSDDMLYDRLESGIKSYHEAGRNIFSG